MKLFDLFTREKRSPLDNPAVSLSSPAIWSWLTGGEPTASGEEVNHQTAMQAVSVYACVRVIAETVASLPLCLYEQKDGKRSEAVGSLLHFVLSREPNPEMTAFTFFETFTGCLALTGNAYAEIARNPAGQPAALWPLHPLKTEPYRLTDGTLAYRTTDGEKNGVWRHINSADIIAIPLFGYDGLKGLSPIMQAKQAIGLMRASEKFGARFFGNGSRPGGVMSTTSPLNESTQQNLRESWERSQSGANQGKTAFLFGDWKYQQIGLSPEESQFLETRRLQREEVAALFRVPVSMIGDTSRLSNANHEQQQLSFLTDTIRPYLRKIEDELTRKLLPAVGRNSGRYSLAFDVSDRLRTDFATQQQGFQTGVLSGWLSRADVRHALGQNPGPDDLSIYMVPINMQASERLLDKPEPAPAPESSPDPTAEERNLLGAYTRAYLARYTAAFEKVSAENKRDYAALYRCFQPVLMSIADLSIEHNGLISEAQEGPAETIVSDVIRSMSKRAAKWPAEIGNDIVQAEFTKAVRSIHINATKEIAAAKAAAALSEDTWTEN